MAARKVKTVTSEKSAKSSGGRTLKQVTKSWDSRVKGTLQEARKAARGR